MIFDIWAGLTRTLSIEIVYVFFYMLKFMKIWFCFKMYVILS